MEKDEISKRFVNFVREKYYQALLEAVRDGKPFLEMDFKTLDGFDTPLAEKLIYQPEETLKIFEQSVSQIDLPDKVELKFRFKDLPEFATIPIRHLRSHHIGQFMSVEGTVRRSSEILPEISETVWTCPQCGSRIVIEQIERAMKKPLSCDCGYKGRFELFSKKLVDTRWIQIEEPFESTAGEKPSQLNIYLRDDLTSPAMRPKTDAGNRLRITGILREVPKVTQKGKRSVQLDILLAANHVETTETDASDLKITPEDEQRIIELSKDPKIYEKIVDSIATSTYGLREIKEAIAYQLFSGVPHIMKDGTRIRGDIHILLIGEPSTGKSQLLKLVSKLANRGKYVSGKGVTSVGLCTTYDSLVFLEDGKMAKIGDLVEGELEGAKNKGDIISSDGGSERKVFGFDQNEMRIKPMRITKYWKIKAPKELVEIETRLGRKIKVTRDNPIPVLMNGEIKWTKAEELKNNYILPVSREINSEKTEAYTTDYVDKNSHLINAADTVNTLSMAVKSKTTIREFCRNHGIKENDMYHNWAHAGKPMLGEISHISDLTGIIFSNILPDQLVLSQFNGHHISLPRELSPEIMYMVGLIAGDGSLYNTKHGGVGITFCNDDKELMDKFSLMCNKMGVEPAFYKHPERIAYYRFHSKIFGSLLKSFGIPSSRKTKGIKVTEELSCLPNRLIAAYLRGLFDTDGSAILGNKGSDYVELSTCNEEFARGLQLLLLRFGIISRLRYRGPKKSIVQGRVINSGRLFKIEIRGLSNFDKFNDSIGFGTTYKTVILDKILSKKTKYKTNIDSIPGIGNMIRRARQAAGLSAKELYGYKGYHYEKGRRNASVLMLSQLVDKLGRCGDTLELEELKKFSSSNIFWDHIKSVKIVENKDGWVYDLTVDKEHSFAANGIIIHNTAAVIKDEQFSGGWVLEAGAMVLANKGVCNIDEFEKMDENDQVSLHEALEQQTISISKASIMATLPAQTAVLAAANPKFGRFDFMKGIAEQITVPETLLSRFDLKFALFDVPDMEKDTKLADHIMKSRTLESYAEGEPILDPVFLRKYVAYARKNCFPKLTAEVGEIIKKFYIDTRAKYVQRGPISITPRQYEALMRLAEASAKIRLSPVITEEDARRAINILQISLQQLGMDKDTGMVDIDKIESGTSSSQRNKIRIILDAVDTLTKEIGKIIPIEDVLSAAENEGITEVDAMEVIERLKKEGQLIEPKYKHLQKV